VWPEDFSNLISPRRVLPHDSCRDRGLRPEMVTQRNDAGEAVSVGSRLDRFRCTLSARAHLRFAKSRYWRAQVHSKRTHWAAVLHRPLPTSIITRCSIAAPPLLRFPVPLSTTYQIQKCGRHELFDGFKNARRSLLRRRAAASTLASKHCNSLDG
jgi:hypothetical protein